MSYQGLILDFGGVVTTDLFAELSAFCIREGLDPGAFARVLNDDREGRNAFEDVESAKISQREFEVTIGRLLGVDDRDLLARALSGLRPRPEVLTLIQRAREAGIKVGLLSNSWGDGQYDPYAGYDLDGIFDAVVISGDTGTRKPDAAIYLIATDELGVPPRECVFADDTAANLPVAEELGMATVHFTDAAKGIREISRLLGLSAGDKGQKLYKGLMPESRADTAVPETLEARPVRPAARGLTGQSIPLASGIAIYGLIMAGQNTTLSLFLVNAVHATPVLVGLFFTARAASGMVASLVTGSVSDRMRDRRVIIGVTSLAGAAGTLCLALLRDYTLLLLSGVVFASIGTGAFGQMFAYANEFATARGRDVTFFMSVVRSVFSAAYIVGPPLGLFIMAKYGFRPLYLCITGLSLASAVIGRWGLRRVPPKVSPTATRASRERGAAWRTIRSTSSLPARTWLLLGVVLVLSTVNQMFNIDISLHVTKDLGHSPQLVGWMLGLTAGLEIPVMIAAGRVAMRVGRGRLVGMSAILAVVSFCLLPVAASPAALLGLAALIGIWQGVALSIPMVMIQDETPGGVGISSSLYGAVYGSASMIAGAITGVTASVLGFGNVFWVCAALSAVAALGMLARHSLGRQTRPH